MALATTITFRNVLLTYTGVVLGTREDSFIPSPVYVNTNGWDVGQVNVETVSGTDASWTIEIRQAQPGLATIPVALATVITVTQASKASALFSLPSALMVPVVTSAESGTYVNIHFHLRSGVSVGVQS